jgi:hypothetical protein
MGFFNDFSNIIYAVVALVIVFGLTESWRIQWLAKRKRERQNRKHDEAAGH